MGTVRKYSIWYIFLFLITFVVPLILFFSVFSDIDNPVDKILRESSLGAENVLAFFSFYWILSFLAISYLIAFYVLIKKTQRSKIRRFMIYQFFIQVLLMFFGRFALYFSFSGEEGYLVMLGLIALIGLSNLIVFVILCIIKIIKEDKIYFVILLYNFLPIALSGILSLLFSIPFGFDG